MKDHLTKRHASPWIRRQDIVKRQFFLKFIYNIVQFLLNSQSFFFSPEIDKVILYINAMAQKDKRISKSIKFGRLLISDSKTYYIRNLVILSIYTINKYSKQLVGTAAWCLDICGKKHLETSVVWAPLDFLYL